MAHERPLTMGLALASLFLVTAWTAPVWAGCTKDTDCKGDRVCNPQGQCVDPEPCPPCDCASEEDPPPVASAPPPAQRPAAPNASTLIITMTDESPTTGIEVSCPGGFRLRVPFEARVATVPGVPAEACSVHFKGAVNARYQPVKGGQSLLCYLQGSTAVCE